jgi:AraC family transcriptional regulator
VEGGFMNLNTHNGVGQSFAILNYIELFGSLPLKISLDLGWKNLLATTLLFPGNLPPLALPPMLAEDEILVQLSRPVQLKVKIGDESFAALSVPGTFSIAPNHLPTTWHIAGDASQVLILSLKHALLIEIALQVLEIDPKYICLAGKVGAADPFIYQIGQLILNELETKGLAGSLFMDSLTQTFAIHLFRNYACYPQQLSRIKGCLPPQVLRAVLEFIDASLGENLSLTKIAAVAHLSNYHFSRLFKRTMHIPVHQYVLQKRLDCGKDLLTRSGLTVTEVAARTGFADTSHFDRHFKLRFGISPVNMIKQSKIIQI